MKMMKDKKSKIKKKVMIKRIKEILMNQKKNNKSNKKQNRENFLLNK